MTKVIFVHRILSKYREEFFELLVKEGARRGLDIRIFYCLPRPGPQPAGHDERIIRVPPILSRPVTIGGMRHDVVIPWGLYRRLSAERPDIIVAEDISALPAGLIVATYGRLTGCPYLIWGLGSVPGKKMSPLKRLFRPLINYFRNGAAAFLGYGEYAVRYYGAIYGKPAFAVYNSTVSRQNIRVSEDDIRARYLADKPLRLVFIGRISAQKRIEKLLEAVRRLDGLDWRLDIIGDGEHLANLKRFAAEMGLAERIEFHGAIYDFQRKAEILTACHLAVMPGLGGLMVQEAYCHGVPVICGPADGTEQDLVGSTNEDLLLREATPRELARTIDKFAALPLEDKVARAVRCVDMVREKYNVENMADSILSALTSVAASRAEGSSGAPRPTSAH